MPEKDSPAGSSAGETPLPLPLPADVKRQAVFSIQGTVYQAWCSIDAWLRLSSADEVIYLEGAEDFDIVTSQDAITVQVKKNAAPISLASAKAHDALENFWNLCSRETSRQIEFHYLTTSSVAMERDADFDGLKGIHAWRAAQTNPELATKVSKYLEAKLPANSCLKAFLITAAPEIIHRRLIKSFQWFTDQADIEGVKRSVNERIVVLLNSLRRSLSLTSNVQTQLQSRFWEVVTNPVAIERRLTLGDLLKQVEVATIANLPIPIDQIPELLAYASPGLNLLGLLLQKSRKPPDPLLRRPALTGRLEEIVRQRRTVLLMGSIHKGKTTLAQLAASALCPQAWWINLTERQATQVDNVFLSLAIRIEDGNCPDLVIIDDLDLRPLAHNVFRDSLRLVLHRANASGRSIILTARGDSGSNSAVVQDFYNIELLDVPELSIQEIVLLCQEHGCTASLSEAWGSLVKGTTSGHPKLVQVRIAELAARGWPRPGPDDLISPSAAVMSVRQAAKELLSQSVPPPVAELVYMISECSILIHRSIAVRLAESVDGLHTPGDIVDSLAGKWLERIEGKWFRATALLRGTASEVWSPEGFRQVHLRLYDAIRAKGALEPFEAAALLFHAFIAQDHGRLAHTAMRLQTIENDDARREVERQLVWLPYVALEPKQTITDIAIANVVLRQLQFQVASTLDSDTISEICQRWRDDIGKIQEADIRSEILATMWYIVGFSQNEKIDLRLRLDAIGGMETLPTSLKDHYTAENRKILQGQDVVASGIPSNGTIGQLMLIFANKSIRDITSLEELLTWLDTDASEDFRQQFDTMLEWPIVQTLGAFVHGAWAANHEDTRDWAPWLATFHRITDYSKRRNSPRFGREAAKAEAIILTEHLERSQEAFDVLDRAEAIFGPSPVLLEQRANSLFYTQNDEMVLTLWNTLTNDPASQTILDPFAHRRAAISAARLEQWDLAEHIFIAASKKITQPFDITKFGLQVDAALVASLGGKQRTAARILAEAAVMIPSEASVEGNQRWEAAQRVAATVCTVIEKAYRKRSGIETGIRPGDASSPALKAAKSEVGQLYRSELTKARILRVAGAFGVPPSSHAQELQTLTGSKYPLVRWMAAQAGIAHAYACGGGPGFIRRILDLETAFADFVQKKDALKQMEPDDGPDPNLAITPERWMGLLVAGMVCSGANLIIHINTWLDESMQYVGVDAALTQIVRLVRDGVSRPSADIDETIYDRDNPLGIRCGAAAKRLLDVPEASKTLELQKFLVLVLTLDSSIALQELFNLHVARHFAGIWRIHAENQFQFYSPGKSVPVLMKAIEDVESGSGTLRGLLEAAASGLLQPLHDRLSPIF
jgi:hypothetical protein